MAGIAHKTKPSINVLENVFLCQYFAHILMFISMEIRFPFIYTMRGLGLNFFTEASL